MLIILKISKERELFIYFLNWLLIVELIVFLGKEGNLWFNSKEENV